MKQFFIGMGIGILILVFCFNLNISTKTLNDLTLMNIEALANEIDGEISAGMTYFYSTSIKCKDKYGKETGETGQSCSTTSTPSICKKVKCPKNG